MTSRHSNCVKAEFYDLIWPEMALFAARDRSVHLRRRRDWQPVFSPQEKVLLHIEELGQQLELKAKSGAVVNVTDFLLWSTVDLMGDFTFSTPFGVLKGEDPRSHEMILQIKNGRVLLGPLTPVPWLLHIGTKLLPKVLWIKDWYKSVDWCQEQIQARLAKGPAPELQDLTYYIMEKEKENKVDAGPWLRGDSLLAVLAGRPVFPLPLCAQ
ncbi:hypothetical protein QC761_0074120 [Podospora bellae-mahoneyi]|uniref:Uncharacterized protein n=1 Tax=Podospora bellae-mahoneyi TaxID=2093777 RepID=A0ABR0FBU4_9PEZI|nr:hypothetical protein QC761_0074120 [Podospora bellae-mahoneyi]